MKTIIAISFLLITATSYADVNPVLPPGYDSTEYYKQKKSGVNPVPLRDYSNSYNNDPLEYNKPSDESYGPYLLKDYSNNSKQKICSKVGNIVSCF